MMDPTTAAWMIGRVDTHLERDAQHLAALREAQAGDPSVLRAAMDRIRALLGREPGCDGSCEA